MSQEFISNKYTKLYFIIIENAQKLSRSKDDYYFENHHILPKCMGGDNSKENLVLLTAREHFICHRLLPKMVDEEFISKLSYAIWQLYRSSKNKNLIITGRTYEQLKINLSKSMIKKKRPPFSQEWRDNMSKSKSGRTYISSEKRTIHLRKIAKNRKQTGKYNPFYGKTHSDAIKKSTALRNKVEYICPHCGKVGKSCVMKRWHFDNCKFKIK